MPWPTCLLKGAQLVKRSNILYSSRKSLLGLFCLKDVVAYVRKIPAPHDPPGAGVTRRPTKISGPGMLRGGSGGTERRDKGAEESEHALHTTRAHDELSARYDMVGEGGATLADDNPGKQPRQGGLYDPPPTSRAETLKVCGSGKHLFFPQSKQSVFTRVTPRDKRGAERKASTASEVSELQAQPPHAHQGSPEKSARPGWDYITTYGARILFLIHWQHREFFKNALKPLYIKGFRPF